MAGEIKSAVLFLLLVVLAARQTSVNAQLNESDPQFVFVHGIGHGAWCFTPLITLLQKAGYTATAIDLTSNGISKALAQDVVTVAQYLEPLTCLFETSVNKSTILVGHSLGGAVISVITEMFPSKVSKAVFLAGVYPANGDSFFSAMPPSVLNRLVGDGNLIPHGDPPSTATLNARNLSAFFYNKTPQEFVNLASTLVVPNPYKPGTVPITLTDKNFGAARKFYVHTLDDLGITPTEQQEMIDASPWKPEQAYNISNADHGVYFSQKTALSLLLIQIAKIL